MMLVRCRGCKTGCSLEWYRLCEAAAVQRVWDKPTPGDVCAVWLRMGHVEEVRHAVAA